MRGRYKNKRDANEGDVVSTLQAFGMSVYRLDQPLDLLVGYAGKTYLAEVKDGQKATYTDAQERFLETWRGQFVRLDSADDAAAWAREVRRVL